MRAAITAWTDCGKATRSVAATSPESSSRRASSSAKKGLPSARRATRSTATCAAALHLGQRGDQRPGLVVAQPVEPDPGHPASRGGEGRVRLEHGGAGGPHQEQRQVGAVDRDVVDEREQRLVRPVQILEHHDERSACGDLVEEAQPRGVVLLRVGLGRVEADERAETLADVTVVRPLIHHALEEACGRLQVVGLEDAGVGLHDLAQRPERPVLAVGHTAAVAAR